MMKNMKELPVELQPYEKCRMMGTEALSNEELLAMILRSGTRGKTCVDLAREILSASRDSLLGLCSMSVEELKSFEGIGEVKAYQLKCIAELSKRISMHSYSRNLNLNKPSSLAEYYMEQLRHLTQEHIILACFDAKCHLIRDCVLSIGSVSGAYTTTREVFQKALEYHAVFIALLHNHPSGDPWPSDADIAFTKEVASLGQSLEIPLVDHIIVGDLQYVSMREEKLL